MKDGTAVRVFFSPRPELNGCPLVVKAVQITACGVKWDTHSMHDPRADNPKKPVSGQFAVSRNGVFFKAFPSIGNRAEILAAEIRKGLGRVQLSEYVHGIVGYQSQFREFTGKDMRFFDREREYLMRNLRA